MTDKICLRGRDAVAGLREWVKEDLKNSPNSFYELGRFLASVSLGTAGVMVTLAKLNEEGSNSGHLGWAAICLLLSLGIALYMAIPKHWPVSGDTDLFAKHRELINRGQCIIVFWSVTWLLGVGIGFAWPIVPQEAKPDKPPIVESCENPAEEDTHP